MSESGPFSLVSAGHDSGRPTAAVIRRFGLGGLTASVASALFAVCAAAPANADTVLMVGGADVQAFPGAENGVYMPAILGGDLCKSGSGNQCLVVPFSGAAGVLTPNNPQPLDAAVASAADRLTAQIKQTPGPKIAVGYSAGAPVVVEAAQRLNNDPNGPPAGELSLITVGNINDGLAEVVPPGTYLQSIGYTVRPEVETKYQKTVVTARNDDLASALSNPLAHPMEALNSVSDAAHAHLGYFNPDISLADPSYQVSTDGNVSHVVLPAPSDAPPLAPVGDVGQPQIASAVTGPIEDKSAPVAQSPNGDVNPAYPMSPGMVDSLIGAAAPAFASVVNDDKDKLVEQLWPVIVEHPEMFNGGVPAGPSPDAAAVPAPGS